MAASLTGPPRAVLIGGTSHAGKSSLARELADRVGYEPLSTDKLARHPGRPWRQGEAPIPPHVVGHYATLAPEALIDSVLQHYGRMWPMVRALIETRVADPAAVGLVLEGSALLPELAASMLGDRVAALWVHADEAVIEGRMRRESRYERADPAERALIDAFLERTRRYQRLMLAAVTRLGLPSLEIGPREPIEAVADRALTLLGFDAA
jgi:2-phosphoglycerate kinase